jgi:hypothetical protein
VSLPARAGLFVDLVRRDCQEECSLAVASRGGGAVSVSSLNWPLPAGPASPARGMSSSDDVYALAAPRQARFWSVGEEEASATVGITPIGAEGQPRVLVEVEAGFEHVKRFHALLALSSAGWVTLWSRDDPPGPHGTAVAVIPSGGVERLLYLDAFFDPNDEAADELAASELVLDGAGTSVTEQPASAALAVYVLPLQEFSTAARAKAARANACLAGTLALPASRFAASATRGVALVKVGVDTSVLAGEGQRASDCLQKPAGKIQQLLPHREER